MSALSLTATHAKYHLLEAFRVPMAVIGTIVFPTLAFCFFVLPQQMVTSDNVYATGAIASMAVFAFMANGLFTFGLDLASQRELPWVPYLRTLPGATSARLIGLVGASLVMALLALVPLLLVGYFFTSARPEPLHALLAIVLVVVTSLPTALIGIIIGSTMSSKVAIAVTQVVMFGLAFGGGLFLPPVMFPDWLDTASQFLPVRQAREIVLAAATGGDMPWLLVIGIVAWTIVLAVVAIVLMRRTESRQYR